MNIKCCLFSETSCIQGVPKTPKRLNRLLLKFERLECQILTIVDFNGFGFLGRPVYSVYKKRQHLIFMNVRFVLQRKRRLGQHGR